VEVHPQDRQHEPQIGGDRRLTGQQRLDALFERDVAVIDLRRRS